MKHLHFVQSLEPLQGGGLGSAALQLHRAMLNQSLSSTLVSTRSPSTLPHALTPQVTEGVRRWPEKLFWAPQLHTAANRWMLDAGGQGVLHGHGFYVYPNWVISRLLRRGSVRLVYHPHGMLEPWILSRSRWKKQLAHWAFENANFRSATLWRALTSREADQIRRLGVTAPIVVLPNGIDVSVFKPRSTEGRTRKRILFLGRLHPKKGLPLLIAAWCNLVSRHPDWEVVIAGPDENGHQAEIEVLISRHGLQDSVRLVGSVNGVAKIDCFAQADLFVLPSYSEGFPMAVLEAMAARLPVVITHECNFPEAGQHGAGWLCDANQTSFTKALGEALSVSDEERSQRGVTGRALVEKSYTWAKIAESLDQQSSLASGGIK